MNRKLRVVGISLVSLAVACASVELGFRLVRRVRPADQRALDGYRAYLLTGLARVYEPRAYTVYQHPRDAMGANALGFSDAPRTIERTPGVPRILCMGGSTTEGGNRNGYWGSYPYQLEQVLEALAQRDFEVMNAGMSGWTTAEMVAAWFLTLQDYAPDVVVLHEAVNDLEPRFRADYLPDYSHWRRPIQLQPVRGPERLLVRWSDLYLHLQLELGETEPTVLALTTYPDRPPEPLLAEGKLPHATSLSFRRNILSIARDARANGAQVVLVTLPTSPSAAPGEFWRFGIDENNTHLRELCAEHGFLLADAENAFKEIPELAEQFIDLVHLQLPGNRAKAEVVARALKGWVAGLSPEGKRPPQAAGDEHKKPKRSGRRRGRRWPPRPAHASGAAE